MDYANSKIYTIRSHQTEKYYIGSTATSLSKRLYQHKSQFNQGYTDVTSREIIKFEDAYIELLEDYPCGSRNELNKREGQLIRQFKNECVNRNIPDRTKKQYRIDNKEKIAEQHKKDYEKNKAYYSEYQKIYRLKKKAENNITII
jgi:predicted GIY-YIG superfamily endonuclease